MEWQDNKSQCKCLDYYYYVFVLFLLKKHIFLVESCGCCKNMCHRKEQQDSTEVEPSCAEARVLTSSTTHRHTYQRFNGGGFTAVQKSVYTALAR